MTTAVANELDLARLRRQDPAEFTRFVRQHERLVLGLCQSLGLKAADCDDAAAETFALAYRALPNFRADSQLSTWLYRIAYRTAIKVRRRYPPPPNMEGPEQADVQTQAPSDAAEKQDTAAVVWRAVSLLDADQAVAVELFYRRGMALEEVASVMEKPTGTVKTLLFRARERLRTLLKSLEEFRMTTPEFDKFDMFLTAALKSRPDPVAGLDLAAAALARAQILQAQEARIHRLARLTRWKRLATIAATLLIGAIITIGYTRLPAAVSDTTTTTTTTSIDLTTLGIAAFIITVIAAVLATLLTSDRPHLRLAAA